MLKRIEFTLNLDDPTDAVLYEALAGPLRHRRAGALVRQALAAFLLDEPKPRRTASVHLDEQPSDNRQEAEGAAADAVAARILEQSAAMFGFS
jgi:hypothetical protein